MSAHAIPRREVTLKHLKLCIFGVDGNVAGHYPACLEQAYFVVKDGQPTARAELTNTEQALVKSYLAVHHPEHAKL